MTSKGHPGTDPRSVVTPDAFQLDPALLGFPLARPGRRFWALVIDAMVVFMITAATDSFWFVLPFIVGFFFLTRAFKKEGPRTSLARLKRFSLGCLGAAVLGGAALGAVVLQIARSETAESVVREALEDAGVEVDAGGISLEDAVTGFGQATELSRAEDPDRARTLALEVGRRTLALGAGIDEVEEMLDDLMPSTVGDRDGDEIVEEVVTALAVERDTTGGPATTPEGEVEAALPGVEATPREAELEARIEALERSVERQRARAEEAETGFGAWLRSKLDTLSFGLGWWTMYFAIVMPWMKGATLGKKLMGIRVVRLDGEPMTWWHAFERAGGYAAGFATGLLGFARVYWDPNRQAIHDKIVGTVVIRAGAQPVPGQWEHLVEAESSRIAGDPSGSGAASPPADPDPTPDDR